MMAGARDSKTNGHGESGSLRGKILAKNQGSLSPSSSRSFLTKGRTTPSTGTSPSGTPPTGTPPDRTPTSSTTTLARKSLTGTSRTETASARKSLTGTSRTETASTSRPSSLSRDSLRPSSSSRESLSESTGKKQWIEMQPRDPPSPVIQFYSSSFHHQTTLSIYQQKAISGDPLAQARVGYCYEYARDVSIDYKESFKWYKLSSEQGHAEGQVGLGNLYLKGLGTGKDEKEGLRLIQASFAQGNTRAQGRLGLIYLKGLAGVEKDVNKGIQHYKLAADSGDVEAQYNLGLCYETGNGIIKDEKEALHYYKLAAEQGYANAQYNLGIYYFNSSGGMNLTKNKECKKTPKQLDDEIRAIYWYKLAAGQNIKEAQYAVGLCYQHGKGGLRKNKEEALRYYHLASEQGLEKARREYNLLHFGTAKRPEKGTRRKKI